MQVRQCCVLLVKESNYTKQNQKPPLTITPPKSQSLGRINHLFSVYLPRLFYTFIHMYLLNKYVLSTQYMPGTVLVTGSIAIKQKNP